MIQHYMSYLSFKNKYKRKNNNLHYLIRKNPRRKAKLSLIKAFELKHKSITYCFKSIGFLIKTPEARIRLATSRYLANLKVIFVKNRDQLPQFFSYF